MGYSRVKNGFVELRVDDNFYFLGFFVVVCNKIEFLIWF